MNWKGWKSYVGALVVAGAAIAAQHGMGQYQEMFYALGAALGISGLRHKMERMAPGDDE